MEAYQWFGIGLGCFCVGGPVLVFGLYFGALTFFFKNVPKNMLK